MCLFCQDEFCPQIYSLAKQLATSQHNLCSNTGVYIQNVRTRPNQWAVNLWSMGETQEIFADEWAPELCFEEEMR